MLNLPLELISYIFEYVTLEDFLTLSRVCNTFRNILFNNYKLWKQKEILSGKEYKLSDLIKSAISIIKNPKKTKSISADIELTIRNLVSTIIIKNLENVSYCEIKIDINNGVEFVLMWDYDIKTKILIDRRFTDIKIKTLIYWSRYHFEPGLTLEILNLYLKHKGFLEIFIDSININFIFTKHSGLVISAISKILNKMF